MNELELIDSFLAPFELTREGCRFPASSGVLVGPGDDCAQLVPSRGKRLIATTDAALDGVHFELGRSRPEDAGWKALAMNLSDLAAAGATPRWFLCSIGIPTVGMQTISPKTIARSFAEGMAPLAKQSGCALVGGNVTRALQWSLTITALGEAKKPLSRAGAKPGDRLILVGELGAAALGLQRLQAMSSRELVAFYKHSRSPRKAAPGKGERDPVWAQLRPEPQLEAGQLAAAFASAAIDVSDGLLQDLGHLCRRSACSARLACASLPRSLAVREAEAQGAKRGDHPYTLSLAGGEEYALLLAVPPRRVAKLLARLKTAKIAAHTVGELTPRSTKAPIALWHRDRAIPLPARLGHDHLAR